MTDLEKLEQLLEDFKIESTTERHKKAIIVELPVKEDTDIWFNFDTDENFISYEVL